MNLFIRKAESASRFSTSQEHEELVIKEEDWYGEYPNPVVVPFYGKN